VKRGGTFKDAAIVAPQAWPPGRRGEVACAACHARRLPSGNVVIPNPEVDCARCPVRPTGQRTKEPI
jgi:hypothetical protein